MGFIHKGQLVRTMVLVSVLVTLLLAFTLSTSAEQAEPVKIVYMTPLMDRSPDRELLLEAKAIFESMHPNIEIELLAAGGEAPYAKATTMLAGGVQIDVLDDTESYIPFANAGMVADLSAFIERDHDVSIEEIIPSALPIFVQEGRLLALPRLIFATGPVINRAYFSEAGLPTPDQLGDGWNWDALRNSARRITRLAADGSVERYGMLHTPIFQRLTAQMHQAGADLFDRQLQPTRANLNTPEVREALRFIAEATQEGIANRAGIRPFFADRNAGIHLHANVNNRTFLEPDDADTFQVVLPPKGPARGGTELVFSLYFVLKDTRHPQAAWEWVKFLAFDETFQQMKVRTGIIPGDVRSLGRLDEYLVGEPSHIAGWVLNFRDVALHPDNFSRYLTPAQSEIDGIFNPGYLKVLAGEEAVESFLERIQPLVQTALDRVQQ